MNAREKLREIDGRIQQAQHVIAQAKDDVAQLCAAIKCGDATTGDPISDFVLATFGRSDSIEKKLRTLNERLRGKTGQHVIVTMSEFPRPSHPNDPYASSRFDDPLVTFIVGILSDDEIVPLRRSGQLILKTNGFILLKEKEAGRHINTALTLTEKETLAYLATDLIGVGYDVSVEIAIGNEDVRSYFQKIALGYKISLSIALQSMSRHLNDHVPDWSSSWLQDERKTQLVRLDGLELQLTKTTDQETILRINAEIRHIVGLLVRLGLGKNPRVANARRRLEGLA